MTPRISILMAVHNGGVFLRPAIESILSQSETSFEFLIVDDGSTDDSIKTVQEIDDPRIRLFQNEENKGLAASLNRGLAVASGIYIARLDADDIALPHRLAQQADYLDRHPEIGLLGSNAILIDEAGRRLDLTDYPCGPVAVRWASLLQNPFIHSSVILRRSVLTDNALRYDDRMTTTQDYDLWLRCLAHTDGANLAEPTVAFRVHGESISSRRGSIQRSNTIRLTGDAIHRTFGSEVVDASERGAILDTIFAGRGEANTSGADRVLAAHRYFDLLDAFIAEEPSGCVTECRRRATTRVAQTILYPNFPKGAFGLLCRSLRLNPLLVFHLLQMAVSRIAQWGKRGRSVTC